MSLTENDRNKIQELVKGNAYYIPKKLLKEDGVKEGITELLKRDGITIPVLNKTLKQQLKAKKVMYVDVNAIRVEVPDNTAIDNALTKGYKLLGALKDNQPIIDNRSITFNGDINKLLDIVKEMQELNKEADIDITREVI